MFNEFRGFRPPKENVTVWRYINFIKFFDMIDSEELFFCRVDQLDDPFEGKFRLKDYEETRSIWQNEETIRKHYFVNCWHINEFQSDAMWRIYLDTKNGIAIKSNFENIVKSLEPTLDDIQISTIRYIDNNNVSFSDLRKENEILDGWASINQFTYKRISFEHEKELRLYYVDTPIPTVSKSVETRNPIDFKKIGINLDSLISEIVIAPFADPWFLDLIHRLLEKYNKTYKVSQSKLYQL